MHGQVPRYAATNHLAVGCHTYLHWVGEEADATVFQEYLQRHPGAIGLWLAGHTHTRPDDRYGNRSHIEKRWGMTFANVAALTRHHGSQKRPLFPLSRLLPFDLPVNSLLCSARHSPSMRKGTLPVRG
jgi:hypothetical protein